MDIQTQLVGILESTLGVPEGSIIADPETQILGAIPEMDSMSLVGILTSLEEQYDIMVDDDEIDAESRVCLRWFGSFGEDARAYGELDSLLRSINASPDSSPDGAMVDDSSLINSSSINASPLLRKQETRPNANVLSLSTTLRPSFEM